MAMVVLIMVEWPFSLASKVKCVASSVLFLINHNCLINSLMHIDLNSFVMYVHVLLLVAN